MISLIPFLFAALIVVFALGYRFYAKLLALALFRPEATESPAAAPGERSLLFAHHVVALAAGGTIAGAGGALIWGWAPVFLWLTVGTVVAGAVLGYAALWLGTRHPGLSLPQLAARILGPRLRLPYFALACTVLLLLAAVSALTAARLLAAFPTAVLPLLLLVALAAGIGRHRAAFWPLTALAVALLLVAARISPAIGFEGELALRIGTAPIVAADAAALWTVLALVLAVFSARRPLAQLARPQAWLAALGLAMVLAWLFAVLLWRQPPLAAPAFNSAPGAPALFPWLFLTLTSGALAGYHALFAQGLTARALARPADARRIGYGGALALGVLALGVLLALGAGFAEPAAWHRAYGDWSGAQNQPGTTGLLIDRFALLVAGSGPEALPARTALALVAGALCLTALEAAIRLLNALLAEAAETDGVRWLAPERRRLWLAAGLTGLLALAAPTVEPSGAASGWWPLFGIANGLLAAFVLLLATVELRRCGRPLAPPLAPLAFILAMTGWGLLAQLVTWGTQRSLGLFGLGTLLLIGLLWMLIEGLLVLGRAAQNNPATPPSSP